MKPPIAVLLLAATSFLASCAPSDTRASDAAIIRALDEQWSITAGRKDVDGTVSFYASDAVLLAPNEPIAADRKSIRASWAGLLGISSAISWKIAKIDVARSGDIAYLYGTYSVSIKDPRGGATIPDTGKIVEVWRKQPGGSWKCIVDTYNSDLPLPPPPEPRK